MLAPSTYRNNSWLPTEKDCDIYLKESGNILYKQLGKMPEIQMN